MEKDALTVEQYKNVISEMSRLNDKVALALLLQATFQLRLRDVLNMKLNNFVDMGTVCHLYIKEQKTGVKRDIIISYDIYERVIEYAITNRRPTNEVLIDISMEQIHKYLVQVCRILKYPVIYAYQFRSLKI